MSIDGRRVLVVGASGGIGKATATRLVQLGAQLVSFGRRKDALQSASNRSAEVTTSSPT